MKLNDEIKKLYFAYLEEEPDASLRSELEGLYKNFNQNIDEIQHRLSKNLSFGTAGIRGRMQAGYNRMNSVSIYRFAYACATVLLKEYNNPIVIIGFDARLNSERFAQEVAQVLLRMGILVKIFKECIPTPLCAFATKYEEATLGIMITASHNPGYDNGIKLFDQKGAQAFGSLLKNIEENMALAPPRSKNSPVLEQEKQAIILHNEVIDAYFTAVKKTKLFGENKLDHNFDIAYTALHGVGQKYILRALKQEGFDRVYTLKEQAEPDGHFPTLVFPNPEEDHALDKAYELAQMRATNFLFANDPDADRLQLCCRDLNGNFVKLSGNEMGSILGYFVIQKALINGQKPLVASSIVSSRMLETIARDMGAIYVDALTGFSNISHAALKKEREDNCYFIFAYEEAIGFLMREVVLDKDGISAGARFMEIAAWLTKQKLSVWQFIDELYLKFGLFTNCQWSLRYEGLSAENSMKSAMDRMRTLQDLDSLIGMKGCHKYDLQEKKNKGPYQEIFANIIIFEIKNRFRFIVRPSGTEPKIKFYLELMDKATDKMTLAAKKSELNGKLALIRRIFEEMF